MPASLIRLARHFEDLTPLDPGLRRDDGGNFRAVQLTTVITCMWWPLRGRIACDPNSPLAPGASRDPAAFV